MALISTSSYTGFTVSGQCVFKALTGAVNLRSSHTIMCRVKHGSTATNYDSDVVSWTATTNTFQPPGSYIGRVNAAAGTVMGGSRVSDAFTPVVDVATIASAYGNTSTWYHLTLAYDAPNNLIRTYIDGVADGTVASTTTVPPSSTSNYLTVGLHNGKMADAALFSRLLSPSEILSMATYRVPQVTSGLVIFWRLDANANDTSGNANNGATTGSAPNISYSTADNPPQAETPALAIAGTMASSSAFAGAMSSGKPVAATAASSSAFSGVTQALTRGTMASSSALSAWIRPRWGRRVSDATASTDLSISPLGLPGANPWTFMTWLRTISGTGNHTFAAQGTGSGGILLGSFLGKFRLAASATGGGSIFDDNTATDDGQWHHLAMTYDGAGTVRAYVDGSLLTSGSGTISSSFSFTYWDSPSSATVAEYAQTKVFAAQLSAAQIVAEKTYVQPHQAVPYAWWQLGWQNVTLDSSGNGKTLTDNGSVEAQTEAPQTYLTLLSGTAASSSALAGAAAQTQALAGAMASSSALTGTARQTQALAGALASSSSFVGELVKPLSGTLASSSAFAGALIQTQALAAAMASSSSFVGQLAKQVSGTLASSSSFTGALAQAQALAGAMATSSAFAGAMTTTRELLAAMNSSSAFAGSLVQTQALAGAMSSSSAFAGLLSVPGAFVGIMASDSAFSGSLGTTKELAGTMATSSALAGATQALVAATMASSSAFTGKIGGFEGTLTTDSAFAAAVLLVSRELAAAMASSSAFVGAMQAQASGQLVSLSAFTGALRQTQTLASAMLSNSQFSGNLTGGTPVSGGGGGDSDAYLRRGAAVDAGRRRIR